MNRTNDRSNDRNGEKSADGIRPSLHRQLFKRRKTCPFSEKGAPKIDYKDIRVLQKYLTERGRIIPRRVSFVSSEHQRLLAVAIKRARHLALLPYVVK
jgi:small subunit ribosomal protein S18